MKRELEGFNIKIVYIKKTLLIMILCTTTVYASPIVAEDYLFQVAIREDESFTVVLTQNNELFQQILRLNQMYKENEFNTRLAPPILDFDIKGTYQYIINGRTTEDIEKNIFEIANQRLAEGKDKQRAIRPIIILMP